MTIVNIICFVLLISVQNICSFRHYQTSIPNGARVVDPCNNRSEWGGVGHQTKEGRTARNPFGRDFSSHGNVWTKSLCNLDSDGDGLTNGEELGDPDCTWQPGDVIKVRARSHPGICEPLSSEYCVSKNLWLNCEKESNLNQVMCASINDSSTTSKELRLAPTLVPSKETTYYCQLFDLNITSDLHMVATQPLITATSVVHHILMFGCETSDQYESDLKSPYPCIMVPHDKCRSLIGAWTVGSPGECAHPEMGFRIGRHGYNTVAIQIHWNNPGKMQGITDNSGLLIHLTSALRKYDAGMLVIGQQYLQIDPSDPGKNLEAKFSANCPERCTNVMFKSSIYVTSAVNHMHYLGKSQEIKVYKNNSITNIITDQDNYDYDDPLIHTFSDPIRINPGDEIRTTCVYKRTRTPNPVCWGEATSEEMCFGFITYYPLQSLSHPWCTSMKSFQSCDRHLPGLKKEAVDGCKWWEFRNASHAEMKQIWRRVYENCYPNHQAKLTCTEECQELTRKIADHPCLQGEVGSYMINKFKLDGPAAKAILDAVMTCSGRDFAYCDRKTPQGLLGSGRIQQNNSVGTPICSNMLLLIIFITVCMTSS